jgi:hypothetical protein
MGTESPELLVEEYHLASTTIRGAASGGEWRLQEQTGATLLQEEKIELGRMFDRLRGEARNRCAEQVEAVLLRICSQIKVNNCRADNEVINLACLIRRQDQESVGDAVFQAARLFDNNFSFDYNGPWVLHNFVGIFLAARFLEQVAHVAGGRYLACPDAWHFLDRAGDPQQRPPGAG